jgi:hypothetical protein
MNETLNEINNGTLTNRSRNWITLIFGFYAQIIMTYSGAVLNFICILIFIKIIKGERGNSGNLFKYLLVKSICDCIFCIQNMPQMFYYRADRSIADSYIMQIWFVYFFYYVYGVLSQLSVWFEIFASIDCILLITGRFRWHKTKLCFWMVTIGLILFMIVAYIPFLFWRRIEKKPNGHGYMPVVTSFGYGSIIQVHHVRFHNFTRDILPLFVSLILNSIILYYIRQMTKRRQQMSTQKPSTLTVVSNNTKMVRKAQRNEKNKIKMIFFSSFTHLFHLSMVIHNFNIFNVKSSIFLKQLCFLSIGISYFIPIISYIAFNSTFKKYISNIICCFRLRR